MFNRLTIGTLAMTATLAWNGIASAQLNPGMSNAAIIRNLPILPTYFYGGAATMVGADGSVLSARWGYSIPISGARFVNPYTANSTTYQASRALRKAQRDAYTGGSASKAPDVSATLMAEYRAFTVPATNESIVSGAALNDSLQALLGMEKTGERQAPGTVSAEVMKSIRFAGMNGDLLNWVRAGEIEFPELLMSADYDIPRKWLKSDFTAAAKQLMDGKQPEGKLLTALNTTGKTLRRTYDARKATHTAGERKEIEAFLNRYDAATAAMGNSANTGLYDPDMYKWGTSVVNLLDFMAKYKLTFAPATLGQDRAYHELHATLSTSAKAVADLFK